MKKTLVPNSTKKREPGAAREYRFDYSKARPNRFAARLKADATTVMLDPDVAMVFSSAKAVNSLLRSVMSAMSKR